MFAILERGPVGWIERGRRFDGLGTIGAHADACLCHLWGDPESQERHREQEQSQGTGQAEHLALLLPLCLRCIWTPHDSAA